MSFKWLSCHYQGERGEIDLLDRGKEKTLKEILKSFDYTTRSVFDGKIYFHNHINYAWENNDLTNARRNRAKKIFSETDILIIIGYSFPPFNKEIDKELFNSLRKKDLEIIYQDPNLDEIFLSKIIDTSHLDVKYLSKKNDNFYFPY